MDFYRRVKHIIIPSLILFVVIFVIMAVSSRNAYAEEQEGEKCLVIMSGYGGYPPNEISKVSSFYEYLNCPDEDITYLTSQSDPDSDGPANVSNVEAAFEWLQSHSQQSEIHLVIDDREIMGEYYSQLM